MLSSRLPTVSIVTPSYNQGRFIEKTVLSVICQDYLNLEYIVVDALSNDETGMILEKYHRHISVLIVEPDRGQTDALNKGFKRSTGEIMGYLNSDDCYASKEVISTVVKYFDQYPEIDVIYGQRNAVDEEGFFNYCSPYRPFSKKAIYLSDFIPQECAFWRRSIFEKAGSYLDDSFQFAMDYELWLRFLKFDAQFLAVEDFFGLFRSYAQQKTADLWHRVGLPEIARLYGMYSEKSLSEQEMMDCHHQYLFGVHPLSYPEAYYFSRRVWDSFITCKRKMLMQRPLDQWSIEEYSRKYVV